MSLLELSVEQGVVDILTLSGSLEGARLLAPSTTEVLFQGSPMPFHMDGDYVVFGEIASNGDAGVPGDGALDGDAGSASGGGGGGGGCSCQQGLSRAAASPGSAQDAAPSQPSRTLGLLFLSLLLLWMVSPVRPPRKSPNPDP